MTDDALDGKRKGIHTNWKAPRPAAPAGPVVEDAPLRAAMTRLIGGQSL